MIKEVSLLAYLLGSTLTADIHGFSISSPVFANRHTIPKNYTCRGKDLQLPLNWRGTPSDTLSLVLIMKDIDAAKGRKYHWALYDIPPRFFETNKNSEQLMKVAKATKNSWGKTNYVGPCPKFGTHHYYFMLYALDDRIWLSKKPSVQQLQAAMRGHVIGETKLIGIVHAHNYKARNKVRI